MGLFKLGVFTDAPGGSLLHSRATNAAIQEHMPDAIECRLVPDVVEHARRRLRRGHRRRHAEAIAAEQAATTNGKIAGQVVMVPVFEADNALRVGRFGWKNQQASLVSFSADAYLNEMGITSPLQPAENTSNGRFVGFGTRFDPVPEPEDRRGRCADLRDVHARNEGPAARRQSWGPPRRFWGGWCSTTSGAAPATARRS